jgi:hypothetical protein
MKIKIAANKLLVGQAFSVVKMPTSGKTYVVPAWVEVPEGTTMNDIEIVGGKETPKTHERIVHQVAGSKGNSYEVVIDNLHGNSCSCVGFTYHRNCKHLKSIIK